MDVRVPPTFGIIRCVGVYFYSSCDSSLGRGPVAEVFAGVDPADVYFILPVTPLWEEDWSQRRPADVVSQTFTFSWPLLGMSAQYICFCVRSAHLGALQHRSGGGVS